MLEYLIRADDGEPDLGVSMKQLAASFTPPGFAPVVLEAVIRGDPIALGDAELSVADEPGFGW